MNSTLLFAIIAIVILFIFIVIFLRFWTLLYPYIKIAKQITRVIDVVKNFTAETAKFLFGLIVGSFGALKVLKLPNVNVLPLLESSMKNIDKIIEEISSDGKRIIITAFRRDAESAVRIANELVEKVPVSLVLFDKIISSEIDERIHLINISSDTPDYEVSTPDEQGASYYINKPESDSIEDYIASLEKGFV